MRAVLPAPIARRMNSAEDPERTLAISYAPAKARAGLCALFALDDALAGLLRTTREPAIAQIRLAWWREQLAALDALIAPPTPILEAIAVHVLPCGITGRMLVEVVEGWEVLVEAERLDDAALAEYAIRRGGGLFHAGGLIVGAGVSREAGEGWALADLSRYLASPDEAANARGRAIERLAGLPRWHRNSRTFGALATIAGMNLASDRIAPLPIGSPRRVARLAWMGLTGR